MKVEVLQAACCSCEVQFLFKNSGDIFLYVVLDWVSSQTDLYPKLGIVNEFEMKTLTTMKVKSSSKKSCEQS